MKPGVERFTGDENASAFDQSLIDQKDELENVTREFSFLSGFRCSIGAVALKNFDRLSAFRMPSVDFCATMIVVNRKVEHVILDKNLEAKVLPPKF
jgi:hypothetical protein